MSIRIVRAILAKDLRSLSTMAIVTALLFAADVIILRWHLVPLWGAFRNALFMLVDAVVIFAVFQLDSAVSQVDDWLCRPVPPRALVSAKLVFLFLVSYVPAALATFFVDLALGAPFKECVLDALLLKESLISLAAPIVLITALVTRTLVQGIAVVIALFVCVFVIPSPFVTAPEPTNLHMGEALFNGMDWLVMTPTKVLPLLFVALCLWLVYWRRRILAARVLLGVTAGVMALTFLAPMWLLPWTSLFAAQKSLEGAKAPAIAGAIYLRSKRACFPATFTGDLKSDAAFNAAREASSVRMWSDEDLRDTGPGSLALLTSMDIRRLPPEWVFNVNNVRADYYGGGNLLFSLRPAHFLAGLAHAWVIPATALHQLASEENVSLKLNYSLTLLEPQGFSLPTDGEIHELPGLGFCRAAPSANVSTIGVECFSSSPQWAQITASLNDVPLAGDATRIDLAPSWTRALYGHRVNLEVGPASLAAHDTITVTAWKIAGYRREVVDLPGILGADSATCPLPIAGSTAFQQARWHDTAPHETSSIGVQSGVQLEVLDFGGLGPAILLLPGLGATAHSFDDIAPRLAGRHRVVAMTRRGAGYSSRPDFGFDTPRLAQDVLQVMDALKIDQALLVGHSIAGEELTWLGGHHPERFTGLVYLDAAYDRSRVPDKPQRSQELIRRLPPEPPRPSAAFRNYESMSRLLAERGHLPMPEGELIAFWQADKPWLGGEPNLDGRAQQAILAAVRAPDYAAVKVPALAIYAIEDPAAPLPPWYDRNDGELLATLAELARIRAEAQRKSIELFRQGVARGRVLEMPHAEHYITQSNPREVLEAIETFSAGSR
jgi:pimeloyl-ACP methyl ester carboxylesterase